MPPGLMPDELDAPVPEVDWGGGPAGGGPGGPPAPDGTPQRKLAGRGGGPGALLWSAAEMANCFPPKLDRELPGKFPAMACDEVAKEMAFADAS